MNRMLKNYALHYSSILFICVGIVAVVEGLLLMFVDQHTLSLPEDARYIGMNATEIIAYNPHLYTWVAVVYRLWGTFVVVSGILVTALAVFPLRNRERWAWCVLAITTIPALLSWMLFIESFNSYFFPTLEAAMAVCGIALALSYPALFTTHS